MSSSHLGMRIGLLLLWGCCLVPAGTTAQSFTIRYIVSLEDASKPVAVVRWEIAGGNEIYEISLRFRSERPLDVQATGTLIKDGEHFLWRPQGPYAQLSYRMATNARRLGSQQRFDSYLAPRWLVSRARHLFPLVRVQYRAPYDTADGLRKLSSRGFLAFQMPRGWKCVAAYPGHGQNSFELRGSRSFLTPRGWFACGDLYSEAREIGGVRIELAQVETAAGIDDALTFLEATFPLLQRLFGSRTDRILIVRAPDPMWHGGISGENSVFLHAMRPVRDRDKTSPYLHELFHVLQPFKPAADADWFVEGLAEYYSLEIQRRAGLLEEQTFFKALRSFERYGLWNVDLRTQHDNAATNNSAPLILYALDQRIQRLTAGKARLDDVVHRLTEQKGPVDSEAFQAAAEAVARASLSQFFKRHVYAGQAPRLNRVD